MTEIPAVANVAANVVAIDFDETITRRDTVIPFLRRVAGTRRFVFGMTIRARRVLAALAARDRDALRAVATDVVFRGANPTAIADHAAEHGRSIIADGLRPDVVDRIRWHLAAGHTVVIVSASYEPYVQVVAEHLGVDGVAATRLEVDARGRLTGRLDGPNCRAAEKVVRLDAWLTGRGLAREDVILWAYGDSAGDRELLAAADHPIWVTGTLSSVSPIP